MTGFSKFSFLRRVRIHDGECGAVARALHHEAKNKSLPAASGKVSLATKERKVMSEKTFFKRIAVVLVAALGLGFLSIIPSQAAVTSHTLTIDAASDTLTLENDDSDSATAVLTHSFVNLGSEYDSVSLYAIVTSSNATNAGTIVLSVLDSYSSVGNTGATDGNGYDYGNSAGALTTAGAIFASSGATYGNAVRDSITIVGSTANRSYGTSLQLKLYSIQAAGTYTVSVYTQVSNAGAAYVSATPAVTWTVTASEPTRTASTASTVTVREGNATTGGTYWNGTAEGTDSQTLAGAWSGLSTVTTPDFSLVVNQKSTTSTNTAR